MGADGLPDKHPVQHHDDQGPLPGHPLKSDGDNPILATKIQTILTSFSPEILPSSASAAAELSWVLLQLNSQDLFSLTLFFFTYKTKIYQHCKISSSRAQEFRPLTKYQLQKVIYKHYRLFQ